MSYLLQNKYFILNKTIFIPGWNIDCDEGVWQQNARDYAGHRCSNWYGWTSANPIGSISTTFNGIGRAQLDFGNCWNSGNVKAILNGTVIASPTKNTPSMTVEFDFEIGSILKIAEHNGPLQAGIEFKKNLRVRFGKYGGLKLEYFWVVKSKKVKSFIRG